MPELVCPSFIYGLASSYRSPLWQLLPEEFCLVTIEDMLGDIPFGCYYSDKSFALILNCLHIWVCCLTMPDNEENTGPLFKFLDPALAGFKQLPDALFIEVDGNYCKSVWIACAFSQIVNHTISSFSMSSLINVHSLDIILTALAGVTLFNNSFWFSIEQIVEVSCSYCFTKPTTCAPLSCFLIISFF